jgi:ADP-ribose pyrophosphatase YjhB (NUDIX family)
MTNAETMPRLHDHPIPAVGAVIVEQGRLLLIRRGAPPSEGLWAVPGGKVHHGETLHGAVVREVQEETGLAIDVGEVAWIGDTAGEPDRHFVLIDFYASVVGGSLRAGDDAAEAAWVPLTDVRSLAMPPTMYQLLDVLDG